MGDLSDRVATVVSIPERILGLKAVVESILPQVDRLNVYLNGYPAIPPFLRDNGKIVVARSQDHGDRKDGSKFWWAKELRDRGCYHFTLDDDINYPQDYVERMQTFVDKHHRRALVGVLGMHYPDKIDDPYKSGRKTAPFWKDLPRECSVNMIGTGTMAYFTRCIELDYRDFPLERMPDVAVAVAAQKQAVPMVVIPRGEFWLRPRREGELCPLYRSIRQDEKQVAVRREHMQSCGAWKIFSLPQVIPLEGLSEGKNKGGASNVPRSPRRFAPGVKKHGRVRHNGWPRRRR